MAWQDPWVAEPEPSGNLQAIALARSEGGEAPRLVKHTKSNRTFALASVLGYKKMRLGTSLGLQNLSLGTSLGLEARRPEKHPGLGWDGGGGRSVTSASILRRKNLRSAKKAGLRHRRHSKKL